MTKLLDVKDLQVTFQSRRQPLKAVRGISFDLCEGEVLGIVGESGCGKSAAIKSLVQIYPKHSCRIEGEIFLSGKNLMHFSQREMQKVRGREIGMIFQDPMTSLNPTLTIGTQIMEGVRHQDPTLNKNERVARALELLELVGIPQPSSRLREYPHTLSGGMRQRIMIALALAGKPKILCADEPTTSLDVTIQAQILLLMKTVQQKTGTSIILITHDLSIVAGFCDRVLVMYAGEIIEKAAVDTLFAAPKHPYTRRLLNSIPRLDMPHDHPLTPIEGTPPNLAQPIKGCSFCPRCPHAMNICALQKPPLFTFENQHQAACWLYDPRKTDG